MRTIDECQSHPETFLRLDQLGSELPPYRPSYCFNGFLTSYHKQLSQLPVEGNLIQLKDRALFGKVIRGWLLVPDALKLYELAYFAEGDVLELGTAQGLSTVIMGNALRDAGKGSRLISVDASTEAFKIATDHIKRAGLQKHVELINDWAEPVLEDSIRKNRRFTFAFVDHAHAYEPVLGACKLLPEALKPKSFVLFHDYNNAWNSDEENKDYGVYQGVRDGLKNAEFFGIYGCTGLFRITG